MEFILDTLTNRIRSGHLAWVVAIAAISVIRGTGRLFTDPSRQFLSPQALVRAEDKSTTFKANGAH